MTTSAVLERRTWCYAQRPAAYDIAPCACGNAYPEWSEFKGHMWCEGCKLDFIPEHNGVFDGPIPVGIAGILGMSFDRVDLATMKVVKFPDYHREVSAS